MSSSKQKKSTKLTRYSYLSPSMVIVGMSITVLLTGLFVGVRLTGKSQETRSQANRPWQRPTISPGIDPGLPESTPAPTSAPTSTPQPTATPMPTATPTQTQDITYTFETDAANEILRIYREPETNQGLTLTIINGINSEFQIGVSPTCSNSECFYQYSINNTLGASAYWQQWKLTSNDADILVDNSNHWQVDGSTDPYQGAWVVREGCPELTADFTGDCQVNTDDRNFLLTRIWGLTSDDLRADIYGPAGSPDGQVDTWDYSLLVSQWTQ